MEEAKKMKCYERLLYKQFVQVSGLCGPQFLSYLPKHFTHLCRALHGDAILVYSFGAPIWPPEINKDIWSSHLERHFFQRDSIPILVSRSVKTRKFKLLYFGNETCYGNGNLCKDLFFCLSST